MIELFPTQTCCIYKAQMVLIVIGLVLCCLGNHHTRIFRESWICTVLRSCSVKQLCSELYCSTFNCNWTQLIHLYLLQSRR